MLIGFVGNLGRGKTLSMTFIGAAIQRAVKSTNGITVSNYETPYSDKIVRDPIELDDVSVEYTGLQLLDEVWAWADARGHDSNDIINDMVINSRKRGWLIIYTLQHMGMIDLRARNVTDYVAVPIHEEHEGRPDVQHVYLYRADDVLHGSISEAVPVKSMTFNPEPIYGMYDTTEEVGRKSDEAMTDRLYDEYYEKWVDEAYVYKSEMVADMTVEYRNVSDGMAEKLATKIKNDARHNGDRIPRNEQRQDGGGA